jgi:uncharacterized protein YfeS
VPPLYFDDENVGPARETSHPEFVRVCEDELFYDCTDEFGPFGNDDGADALRRLEDWHREGGNGLRAFVDGLLDEWGVCIPDLATSDRDTVGEWLRDNALEIAVRTTNNLVIAVAFGSVKITGKLDRDFVVFVRAALDREALLMEHWTRRDPTWPHAANARAANELKRAALEQLDNRRTS